MPDGPPLYAVDVSVWPRPGAATSPERGYQYHSPRRRDGRDPVVPGWAYQWLTRLSWDRDSWTAPVDVRRVRPEEKPTAVAVEQLKALVAARPAAQRGEVPLVLFDAGYDASGFTDALAGTPVALLIRLRSNRHFWFAPVRATAHHAGPPEAARGQVRLQRPGHLARPDRRAARRRRGLRPGARCAPGRGSTPTCGAPCGRASSGSTGAPGGSPTGRWCAWRSAASPAGGAPRTSSGCGGSPPPAPGGAPRPPSPEDLDRPVAGVLPQRRSGADLQIPEAGARAGSRRGCACPSRPTAGPGWCSRPTPSCASPAGPSPTTACRGSAPSRRPGSRPRGCTGVLQRWRGACPPSPRRQNPAGAPRAGPKGAARRRRRATRPSRRPPDPGGPARPRPAAAFATTCGVAARAGVVKRPGAFCCVGGIRAHLRGVPRAQATACSRDMACPSAHATANAVGPTPCGPGHGGHALDPDIGPVDGARKAHAGGAAHREQPGGSGGAAPPPPAGLPPSWS